MNRLRVSATAVALSAVALAFAASGAVAAPAPTASTALPRPDSRQGSLGDVTQYAMGDAVQVLHRATPDGTGDSGWGGR